MKKIILIIAVYACTAFGQFGANNPMFVDYGDSIKPANENAQFIFPSALIYNLDTTNIIPDGVTVKLEGNTIRVINIDGADSSYLSTHYGLTNPAIKVINYGVVSSAGAAIDISNRKGAGAPFVIHNYSEETQNIAALDNTAISQGAILKLNNAHNDFYGLAGIYGTKDFITAYKENSLRYVFRLDSSGYMGIGVYDRPSTNILLTMKNYKGSATHFIYCLDSLGTGAPFYVTAGGTISGGGSLTMTNYISSGNGYRTGATTVIDANRNLTNIRNITPETDNTYYVGKNDDDTPLSFKGIILKDTANGRYYRIEITNGSIVATDLTD
jgi:hypothetical protein